jgi:hypothetical protein
MLGRTFLQETYVTVDHERLNFSISQAYPDGGSAYIVPISHLPAETPDTRPTTDTVPTQPGKLSSAAYAGIGIGTGVAFLAIVGVLIAWWKQWGVFQRKELQEGNQYDKAELHGEHKPWVEAMGKERTELDAAEHGQEIMGNERSELETVEPASEMTGSDALVAVEVPRPMHELPGSEVVR